MDDYEHLRLKDRIAPGAKILFVGINPGVRSALTGHHFAGPSNNFWKLLFESGLVPRRVTHVDDDRLVEWGYGITNIVARPTPGVSDLTLAELRAGRAALERKVRRYRPEIVALVGITVYRALFPPAGGASALAVAARAPARTVSSRVPRPIASATPRSGCCRIPAGATPTTATPRW